MGSALTAVKSSRRRPGKGTLIVFGPTIAGLIKTKLRIQPCSKASNGRLPGIRWKAPAASSSRWWATDDRSCWWTKSTGDFRAKNISTRLDGWSTLQAPQPHLGEGLSLRTFGAPIRFYPATAVVHISIDGKSLILTALPPDLPSV